MKKFITMNLHISNANRIQGNINPKDNICRIYGEALIRNMPLIGGGYTRLIGDVMCANVMLFKENDVENIVSRLGFDIEGDDKHLKDEKDIVHCEACESIITVKNIGCIAKGSKLLYCDSIECISQRSIDREN